MGRIDEALEKRCKAKPDEHYDAVVVLTNEAEGTPPGDIGLAGAEPIPYQPGMYKVRMKGEALLDLAKRSQIAEVGPDSEAKALDEPE